ncbi:MAG: amidohydrolase family protein, partial [Phycisphaerales bacterium]|nr:amidohydrolase family protein [Phycisphaerales bacterium]
MGATIHIAPGKVLDKANVVMHNGAIVSVGTTPPPAGATTHDATGLHIYAGFVEPYLEVDAPMPDRDQAGGHWSSKVNPDRSPLRGKGVDASTAEALRKMGYGAAAISPRGGIFRGSAALVSLAKPDEDASQSRPPVYAPRVYHVAAFDTGRGGPGGGGGNADREDVSRWDGYPGSEMGVIALMRQTLSDAAWQQAERESKPHLPASALDALALDKAHPTPLAFITGDELQSLRARRVAKEFDRRALVVGSGTEYQRLDAIVKAEGAGSAGLIVPLNYPKKPSITSVADAEALGLNELAAWEQAPTNPRRLVAAGLKPALTTSKVKDRSSFWGNLRTAIRHGLKEDDALAMLTTTPAAILGTGDQLGAVEGGKRANLVVADGPIFAKHTKVRDVWIDGKRHEINAAPTNLKGEWEVMITPPPDKPGQLRLSINKDNAITVKKLAEGDEKKDATAKTKSSRVEGKSIAFTFDHEPFGSAGIFTLSGTIEGEAITGDALRQDGRRFAWVAKRIAPEPVEAKKEGRQDEKKADEPKKAGDKHEAAKPEGDKPAPDVKEGEKKDAAPKADDKDKDKARDDEEDEEPVKDVPEKLTGLPFGAYALEALPEQG